MSKERIRKWLGITKPTEPKDFTREIAVLSTKVDIIEDIVKKAYEYECANCHKTFVRYPFGGGYYREHDGTLLHSSKCLDEWSARKRTGND